MDPDLISALAGGDPYGADAADAEDAFGGLSIADASSFDGNNDRMQGSEPAESIGSSVTPEAAAAGTGPNPTGQVLARLRTPRSNPYDNTFGSELAAGMAAARPGMSAGSAFAHGLVGGLAQRDVSAQKAALWEDAQAKQSLAELRALFSAQQAQDRLNETIRYHDQLAGKVNAPKAQWHQTGTNEFGEPSYGWVFPPSAPGSAPATSKGGQGQGGVWGDIAAGRTPSQGAAPGAAGAAEGERSPMGFNYNLQGEDFLKDAVKNGSMQESEAARIRAIAQGREKYPSGTKAGNRIKQLLQAYDPSADENKFLQRKNMFDAWSKTDATKQGGRIESGKRAIDHLLLMSNATEKLAPLENMPGNLIRNFMLESSGGNMGELAKKYGITPEQTDALRLLKTQTDVFAKEAEKFYRGASGSTRDIEAMKKQLDPTQAGHALKAAISAEIGLMRGQFKEMRAGWQDIMGDQPPPRTLYPQDMVNKINLMYRRAKRDPIEDGDEPEFQRRRPGAAEPAAPAAAPRAEPPRGTGATPSATSGATPQPGMAKSLQNEQPPMAGAVRAPNGDWVIKQNGQWHRIEP